MNELRLSAMLEACDFHNIPQCFGMFLRKMFTLTESHVNQEVTANIYKLQSLTTFIFVHMLTIPKKPLK